MRVTSNPTGTEAGGSTGSTTGRSTRNLHMTYTKPLSAPTTMAGTV